MWVTVASFPLTVNVGFHRRGEVKVPGLAEKFSSWNFLLSSVSK